MPLEPITLTVVKFSALPLSPVHLNVRVTACALLGIVRDIEPEAVAVPFHPLRNGLATRTQLKLFPNPDAAQRIVVTPLTIVDLGLALIDIDGPMPSVLTLTLPLAGSTASALSLALGVSGVG